MSQSILAERSGITTPKVAEERTRTEKRTLTLEETLRVLAHAEVLSNKERMREIVAQVGKKTVQSEQGFSLQTLYELGENEGISSDYVQRSLELLCPSREQKLEDLKKYGARYRFHEIEKIYAEDILELLQRALPCENFTLIFKDISHEVNSIYVNSRFQIYSVSFQEKRWFFGKKRVKEVRTPLVEGQLYSNEGPTVSHRLNLAIHSPYFLRVCGEELQELSKNGFTNPELSLTTTYSL
ncbi:hypothetical protein HYX13_03450 [Candidatus Woesearchaeota archaeon]|nr:hypothetical protein [Candidatus Woesearchaeota archaeon]